MGTNFYADVNKCSKCLRCDRFHIGKSSAGWRFSFHGERESEVPDSWETWKKLLSDPRAEIVDEYGRPHTLGDFEKMVIIKQGEKLGHSTLMIAANQGDKWAQEKMGYYQDDRYRDRYWIDPEGFEFSAGEFS